MSCGADPTTQLDLFAMLEIRRQAEACEVDLASYDIILVNSSAGKDSQAMMDEVVRLADAAGVRDRIVVAHADMGRVEWEGTRELAGEHAAHYGLPFEVVRRSLGDLLDQVEQRHAANVAKGKDHAPWPSSEARWCTSDQKTSQVLKLMTRLVAEVEADRPVRILNCLGIRAAESSARARKVPFGPDRQATNGRRHVDRWLPIFAWSEDQVWARIATAGTRPHPAYAAGMPRLSCCFCVLAGRSALVRAAQLNPALAAEYEAVEERVGFTFRVGLSIAEIVAEAEALTAAGATAHAEGWAA